MNSIETLLELTFSGRRFTRQQLAQVQETVARFSQLSRNELAHTLYEHLKWKTPNGKNKVESCLVLLEKLEAQGIVKLPARQVRQPWQPRAPILEPGTPQTPIEAPLRALMPIQIEPVGSPGPDREQWKAYLETFHYKGYRQPVGPHRGYFIVSERSQQRFCIHVVDRALEELLLLQQQDGVLDRLVRTIAARHHSIRPNRSFPRQSRRPETKWPSNNEKRNRQTQQTVNPSA